MLFVNPNKEEAEQLIKEVEGNGTKWSERFAKVPSYAYDERFNLLEQYPDKWFKDPSA